MLNMRTGVEKERLQLFTIVKNTTVIQYTGSDFKISTY